VRGTASITVAGTSCLFVWSRDHGVLSSFFFLKKKKKSSTVLAQPIQVWGDREGQMREKGRAVSAQKH